jgi:hypothetical protein
MGAGAGAAVAAVARRLPMRARARRHPVCRRAGGAPRQRAAGTPPRAAPPPARRPSGRGGAVRAARGRGGARGGARRAGGHPEGARTWWRGRRDLGRGGAAKAGGRLVKPHGARGPYGAGAPGTRVAVCSVCRQQTPGPPAPPIRARTVGWARDWGRAGGRAGWRAGGRRGAAGPPGGGPGVAMACGRPAPCPRCQRLGCCGRGHAMPAESLAAWRRGGEPAACDLRQRQKRHAGSPRRGARPSPRRPRAPPGLGSRRVARVPRSRPPRRPGCVERGAAGGGAWRAARAATGLGRRPKPAPAPFAPNSSPARSGGPSSRFPARSTTHTLSPPPKPAISARGVAQRPLSAPARSRGRGHFDTGAAGRGHGRGASRCPGVQGALPAARGATARRAGRPRHRAASQRPRRLSGPRRRRDGGDRLLRLPVPRARPARRVLRRLCRPQVLRRAALHIQRLPVARRAAVHVGGVQGCGAPAGGRAGQQRRAGRGAPPCPARGPRPRICWLTTHPHRPVAAPTLPTLPPQPSCRSRP